MHCIFQDRTVTSNKREMHYCQLNKSIKQECHHHSNFLKLKKIKIAQTVVLVLLSILWNKNGIRVEDHLTKATKDNSTSSHIYGKRFINQPYKQNLVANKCLHTAKVTKETTNKLSFS